MKVWVFVVKELLIVSTFEATAQLALASKLVKLQEYGSASDKVIVDGKIIYTLLPAATYGFDLS